MLLMRLEHQIRVILVMVLIMSASYTQSLLSFVDEWDGTESLISPIENYDGQDVNLNIAKGGDREGFLIFTSSSDMI